jgi:tripartite-type tricarboxylate transporter receptor subunit TctC
MNYNKTKVSFMSKVQSVTGSAIFAAALLAVPGTTQAQSEDYFKGKTVTIAVAGTAGSGIDMGARMVGRYIGKYLPGSPAVRVELMPGGGGVRLLEYLFAVAPKDGTYIGAFATGPILEPLISGRATKYKTSDFTAVGAIEKDTSFCLTWHASPAKTIQDAMQREVTVAGTGAAASTDIFPVVLNAALGTKFRVISGYVGTQETILAVERGETDGRCGWSYSSIMTAKPDWLRDKKVNILVQLGLEKHPNVDPSIPLALDLIPDQAGRQLLRVLLVPQQITRPYLAPPGLSPERAADIRGAFTKAMQDGELQAEFEKIVGSKPSPTTGEDMQKLLNEIYTTPADVVARLKSLLNDIR